MLTGAIIEIHTGILPTKRGKKGIYKGLCEPPNLTLFLIEKDTESDISASQIVCTVVGLGGIIPSHALISAIGAKLYSGLPWWVSW